jgi:hypothetical protein
MSNWKKISQVLIPLSLFTSCAFADKCCTPPPPKPKECRPCPPKKEICCECYNPQYYSLKDDCGVFVSADFLYFYARESNLELGNTFKYIESPNPSNAPGTIFLSGYFTKHHYLDTKWDPGFRVGLGFNTDLDGCDLYFNWTWFRNSSSKSLSSSGGSVIPPPPGTTILSDPYASSTLNPINLNQVEVNTLSGKWSLQFNQIDAEFGRKSWVSRRVALRPYVGLRAAWTHTNFHVKGSYASPTTLSGTDLVTGLPLTVSNVVATSDNKFTNKFWGVGLLGGLQPEFFFNQNKNFSLFGNVDGALLWGNYKGTNRISSLWDQNQTFQGLTSVVNSTASQPETDAFARMQGIVDLAIGLRWVQNWDCDRYMTALDVGWEHHYWFDYGLYHENTPAASDATNFDPGPPAKGTIMTTPQRSERVVTNLGFGGLVVRFRFDF